MSNRPSLEQLMKLADMVREAHTPDKEWNPMAQPTQPDPIARLEATGVWWSIQKQEFLSGQAVYDVELYLDAGDDHDWWAGAYTLDEAVDKAIAKWEANK